MKKYCIIFFLLIATAFTGFANNSTIHYKIRFYNKRIYYPDTPIYLQVELKNNTSSSYKFKLSDENIFNLDFRVKTLTNLHLDHSHSYILKKNRNEPIRYRDFTLEPGQALSFEVQLQDFIEITKPGMYIVESDFFPDMNLIQKSGTLTSNMITLNVRPGSDGVSTVIHEIDEATGEILRQQLLPPDQVVEYTINARQRSKWNKFFLYLDLERLLMRENALKRTYLNSSEENRMEILESYKNKFINNAINSDINLIPSHYEILKTTYTQKEATVVAIEKFRNTDYTEVKQYTYYLHKKEGIWQIYDYAVLNMGTE